MSGGRLKWNRPHVPYGRDRGLALDAERRALGFRPIEPGLTAFKDAIKAVPSPRGRFLNLMLNRARRGLYPSQRMLDCVNENLERHGRPRVSCPVGNSGRSVNRIRIAERESASRAVDVLASARPLKPPSRKADV